MCTAWFMNSGCFISLSYSFTSNHGTSCDDVSCHWCFIQIHVLMLTCNWPIVRWPERYCSVYIVHRFPQQMKYSMTGCVSVSKRITNNCCKNLNRSSYTCLVELASVLVSSCYSDKHKVRSINTVKLCAGVVMNTSMTSSKHRVHNDALTMSVCPIWKITNK